MRYLLTLFLFFASFPAYSVGFGVFGMAMESKSDKQKTPEAGIYIAVGEPLGVEVFATNREFGGVSLFFSPNKTIRFGVGRHQATFVERGYDVSSYGENVYVQFSPTEHFFLRLTRARNSYGKTIIFPNEEVFFQDRVYSTWLWIGTRF